MTQLHLPSALNGSNDVRPGALGASTVASLLRQREGDERLFTVLLWLSFPFFLVLAASARLMQGGTGERRASVFAVAAEAARSTIAIAFNQ
jgi:hypothetical protein